MPNKMIIVLFAGCLLVNGCCKSDGDSASSDKGSGSGSSDLPQECQDYLKQLEKCADKVPAMKPALEQTRKSYEAANSPTTRTALVPGCKAAADALKQNPACK